MILEKNACSIEVDRKYDLTSGRKVTPARKDELKVRLQKEITTNWIFVLFRFIHPFSLPFIFLSLEGELMWIYKETFITQ